jgi:hypothetical protein
MLQIVLDSSWNFKNPFKFETLHSHLPSKNLNWRFWMKYVLSCWKIFDKAPNSKGRALQRCCLCAACTVVTWYGQIRCWYAQIKNLSIFMMHRVPVWVGRGLGRILTDVLSFNLFSNRSKLRGLHPLSDFAWVREHKDTWFAIFSLLYLLVVSLSILVWSLSGFLVS